jgi:hypothetical protein
MIDAGCGVVACIASVVGLRQKHLKVTFENVFGLITEDPLCRWCLNVVEWRDK